MNKLRITKTGGTYSTHGGEGCCIHNFGGESCSKRLLGRPRRKCGDNIKMEFLRSGMGMDRIDVAQERNRLSALANEVTQFRVP